MEGGSIMNQRVMSIVCLMLLFCLGGYASAEEKQAKQATGQ
jgi:hypothetical protein